MRAERAAARSSGRSRDRHLRAVRPDEAAAPRRRDRSVGLLLASTGLLTVAGLVMVLSASSVSAYDRYGSSFLFFRRQLLYAAIGGAALLVTSRMRVRAWQRLAVPLTVVAVALLVLVLHPAAGQSAGGSARWLALGPFNLQPSELAKFAIVALTATIVARKWKRLDDPAQIALPLAPIVGLVCLLVLLQPDLGTMTVIAASVFLVLFVAGVRIRYLALVGALAGAAGTALILVAGYRKARLLSFLNPWSDPHGAGFQVIQSLIGFVSGSWTGVGIGASRQKWSVLPNAHTDFIFSIVGEELGLIGTFVLLTLFGLFLYAGIRIAMRAPDRFARLLSAGIVAWLGFQTIVNLGAVTGMLPITGVPLPFVSFGGSSLVVSLAAVGVLVRIGRESAPVRSGQGRSR